MNALHDVVAKNKFPSSDKVFAYSEQYVNFVTMETITEELLRNILLALLCVFLATLLLMAHLIISLMVVANVAITLVNVAGCMYFWGLTIETAAAILLTISLGLAVDYSAHVAHAFMSTPGESRNERMKMVITCKLSVIYVPDNSPSYFTIHSYPHRAL
jgi:Niemann-Pick C1 protein